MADAMRTTGTTIDDDEAAVPSSGSLVGGRFTVGSIFGGRYRMLRVLGRGGMGEVYQAHDSKLNQDVALKFLPASTSDPGLLERFRAEVRVARQVSHPNVCRVYDLGEADGIPFISMEYVDGEDLRSLLRRIGRLPPDKALEIARRLCAGLAAAHALGVLHRDLKPANVMIDGRGQVHVMDFGLADIADRIEKRDVRSGTPAYMAPEQRDGQEVTARSDLYALGLVLYEMFTGQRAFTDNADRSMPPHISSLVSDVDPAIDKIIRTCLDPNPARRPASALDVARALPGGDPLADALVAGETPSPADVAASEETGALSIRSAIVSLIVIAAALVGVVLIGRETETLAVIPAPESPEILARQARSIAADLGYTDTPEDSASAFQRDEEMMAWSRDHLDRAEYHQMIGGGRLSPLTFHYRESPERLIPTSPISIVGPDDPPLTIPGMVSVELDPQGRLLSFLAVPPREIEIEDASVTADVDWQPLLEAADLDPSDCVPSGRRRLPLVTSDAHLAWSCVYPDLRTIDFHVDAASWNGRPVYFEVGGPWSEETRAEQWPTRVNRFLFPPLLVLALLFAWRNYRRGRGDLSGAFRLATIASLTFIVAWLMAAHHGALLPAGLKLGQASALALFGGAMFWTMYIALEPYVRRRWPQSLISWTRIVAGNWRDPVVAGHVLVGCAAGMVLTFAAHARELIAGDLTTVALPALEGMGPAVSRQLQTFLGDGAMALLAFFLFFLLRALLRRAWIAAIVIAAIPILGVFVNPAAGGPTSIAVHAGWILLAVGTSIWLVARFGVLPFAFAFFIGDIVYGAPMTGELTAWYSYITMVTLLIVVGVSVGSFYLALGGRTLLRDEFLES